MDVAQETYRRGWAEHRRLAQRRLNPQGDWPFRTRLRERFGDRAEAFSEDLLKMLHALWGDAVLFGMGCLCERCGTAEAVAFEDARTAYGPTEEDPCPNAPVPLCRVCAAEHHAHWDEMWREYHGSRG